MWGVHPDAFQCALTPIPRNGVVRIGIVPINLELRSTIYSDKKHDPSGEEMLPRCIRHSKSCFGQFAIHNFAVRQCDLGFLRFYRLAQLDSQNYWDEWLILRAKWRI